MREQKQTSIMSEQTTTRISNITAKAGSGRTVIIERILMTTQGNKSGMRQKADDELGNTQIVYAEVHAAPRLEDKANPVEEKKGNKNASDEKDQPVVEFEDQSDVPARG